MFIIGSHLKRGPGKHSRSGHSENENAERGHSIRIDIRHRSKYRRSGNVVEARIAKPHRRKEGAIPLLTLSYP
jgi:hypothetical protein